MCVFRQWYSETRNLGAAEVPSNVCSGQSITRSSWSPEVTIGLPGSDFSRLIFHFLCSIVVKHSFYYPPFFLKFGTLPLLFVVRSSDLLLLMYIYITVLVLSLFSQPLMGPGYRKNFLPFSLFPFCSLPFPLSLSIPLSSCFLFCVLRYPPQLY